MGAFRFSTIEALFLVSLMVWKTISDSLVRGNAGYSDWQLPNLSPCYWAVIPG